jgi:trimethylamine--corrinoid protein Co-methyltransferase
MARIVFGRDFVDANLRDPWQRERQLASGVGRHHDAGAYALMRAPTRRRSIVPFILGGAMGPLTSAGAIAQSLAETMAGCALTQLERPGAPVIFGNFLSSMSLRSGSPTFGTPSPPALPAEAPDAEEPRHVDQP